SRAAFGRPPSEARPMHTCRRSSTSCGERWADRFAEAPGRPETADPEAGYPRTCGRFPDSWITALTPSFGIGSLRHPHWGLRQVRLLLAWNRALNLTAIRDAESIAREHVLDSLTAGPLLLERGVKELLDLGSGGGFPGLPLAVSLNLERTLLVESVGKKARFLDAAAGVVGLGDRLSVANSRVEALASRAEGREAWPLVTARAVASLAELVELAFPLLSVGGALLAWKRAPV